MRIELSTDTVEGAIAADGLGADRIELCSAGVVVGALTPEGKLDEVVLGELIPTRPHGNRASQKRDALLRPS
ncbi:hypothetical protein FPZ12_032255 [Amycolatopsis acidicola]|uniref:Uncharacterized protein n=1 Tax=Amycolatopsis acidicola TaxID=2596893 RepID=A0A5N0UY01_9PSEU|nr:hypothetical protein FPZ12_032255 [Amycolatopsis acidicola]